MRKEVMLKRIPAIAAVSIMLVCAAVAGPADDALQANLEGKYAKAYRILSSCAERDDGSCQWLLGTYYENGRHVSRDLVVAYKWYVLAPGARKNPTSISASARDRIAKLMAPAEIDRARQLIRDWQKMKRPN